jgi:hypothetical protein
MYASKLPAADREKDRIDLLLLTMYAESVGWRGAMTTKIRDLTWANVDVDDNAEMKELRRQEELKARQRAQDAVRRLQEQGIMDVSGRRIRKEVPPDMRGDSDCDLG